MGNSFQLLRTNVKLTTNIKLVIDSKYNLYFESFDSNKELSDKKYKHYILSDNASLENEIPIFYDKLPKKIAFEVKNNGDEDVMYNEYKQQFDNIYYAGANEISDTRYKEEFEYLAPIYINKNNIPKKFIILRVDEPTIYDNINGQISISNLNKDNFRKEIINKWKCVELFDMTDNTKLGKFLNKNINDNDRFPDFTFFFDTKKYNYSKWSGLEYDTGIYKTSEMFLDDKIYYENPHFNLEEFITNGFENNGLIYPNILNLKFIFDDYPADPNEFKNWSMNRYYGFYIDDFELVFNFTSYELPELKDGLIIKNNIFLQGKYYINPFTKEYTDDKWIQVNNDYYKVKRQSNGSYKIISDKNLTDYDVSEFNKGACKISNNIIKTNVNVNIDEYVNENGEIDDMYADIYLININGIYHILRKNDGNYFIDTDYAISSDGKTLIYWKGGKNNKYHTQKQIIQDDGSILTYKVYRLKLTDIKDFDFDRIKTGYADFEYEKSTYVDTPEPKLYAKEYRDNSIPTRYKTHDLGEDGQYKIKNISSEYTAGDETFELRKNEISPIFNKNQSICKWSYIGSNSHSDYPYKLNNNYEIGGTYNRTTNPNITVSDIQEKTHDYFYRIGEFYGKSLINLYSGFDENFQLYWSGNTSEWGYDLYENDLVVDSYSDTTYLEFKEKIIENNLYYIKIEVSDINYDNGYEMGVDPNSFPNGVTTKTDSLVITLIERSVSDTLKIFVKNADLRIKSIVINEIENKYYLNQSTNIQTELHFKLDPNTDNRFNLNHYVNSDFDYFDYFFKNIMYYEDFGKLRKKMYYKYSTFGGGDDSLPSSTLFKGIEYKMYSVEDIILEQPVGTEEKIRKIITNGGTKYNNYKFSVILSENYKKYKLNFDGENYIDYDESANIKNESINGVNILTDSNKNGIHVLVNDKYKNILVIINQIIPINVEWNTLNNVDIFGENNGLYFGKTKDNKYNLFPLTGTTVKEYNPNFLTSYFYVNSLNNVNIKNVYDNFVSYYLIDENGNFASTEMIKFNKSNFNEINNWSNKFPPFYLDTDISSDIDIKKKSYEIIPIKGPTTNIYDKYIKYSDGVPLTRSYIDQPLSRKIKIYEKEDINNSIEHGEKSYSSKIISRYIGYYEPIFKNITIFKPKYYWFNNDEEKYYSLDSNYRFGDDLEYFGMIDELMYSKVNENNNYLKLKNTDNDRSYYPMIDEIGLSQTNRFIFLSPWDQNFYLKTLNEQTLLDNYIKIPEQIIESPMSAQIVSTTSPIIENYSNGVKIYGKNLDSSQLNFSADIKNLSESAKKIKVSIEYISDYLSTGQIKTGYTNVILPNDIDTISFNIDRPEEINSGESNYEEYTLWKVVFRCFDDDDNELDSNDSSKIRVYNDLINLSLSNPTVEDGWTNEHNIEYLTDFSIKINESNKKLSTVYYFSRIYIDDGTSNYVLVYDNTFASTFNATGSLPITKNYTNVNINNSNLNIDPGETVNRSVKFQIRHQYQIEQSNHYIYANYIQNDPKLSITREQDDPILNFNNTSTLSLNAGECEPNTTIGTYTGDQFIVNNIQIHNSGGNFTGNINLNLVLYKKGLSESTFTATTITKSVTLSTININSNNTYTINSTSLPKEYPDGTPLLTFNSTEYKVIIESSSINNNEETGIINGAINNIKDLVCMGLISPDPTDGYTITVVLHNEGNFDKLQGMVVLKQGTAPASSQSINTTNDTKMITFTEIEGNNFRIDATDVNGFVGTVEYDGNGTGRQWKILNGSPETGGLTDSFNVEGNVYYEFIFTSQV